MDTKWRTSTYSGGSGCVEVRRGGDGGMVQVRDSKRPDSPVLNFGLDEWRAFVDAAKGSGP